MTIAYWLIEHSSIQVMAFILACEWEEGNVAL